MSRRELRWSLIGVATVVVVCVWLVAWKQSKQPDLEQFTRIQFRHLSGPIVRPFVVVGMTEKDVIGVLGEPDPGDPMFCVNAGPVSMSISERMRLTPVVLNYRSYGLIVLIDRTTRCVVQVVDATSR